MAKRLKLTIEPAPSLKVMVANGVRLNTQGLCRAVQWEAQGYRFITDFLVLSVKGFNLVLGIQWLLSLGPIIWDFAKLTMQFQCGNQTCNLRGIVLGAMQLVSSSRFSKCMSLAGNGPCTVLLTSGDQTILTLKSVPSSSELQKLLGDFEDVFQVPTQLPPPRLQDHKIPLVDESQVVKIRPYRYPVMQKAEIDILVQEML